MKSGLALAPWNVLAGGKIRTDEEEEKRRQTGERGRTVFSPDWERNDKEKRICKALEQVASEVGAKSITSGVCLPPYVLQKKLITNLVAIAYVMHKTPYVFPIIGGRKVEHLLANLEALDISLSDEQIKFLEGVEPFDLGFPHWLIVRAILVMGI